ncbi:hypothetical protein Tco_0991813 [Tanacetum coccineum]|uniref:Uncharacterized protein n=1 Tax=Tanacetum coccineum TaxID=301880 RepID=A0ABQ5F0M8_9ASTR
MNQEEIRQVTARDEKWVPAKVSVKISTTNVRLETTMPQKGETFQVIIDVIKNSTCYKAFTISIEVPKMFMQQFWYIVKKVKGKNSYKFHLANKKCVVDVEVFQNILDICLRFQGLYFAKVPDDETTLTFLIDLGYKGLLYKHPSMYVDHMHQPWRTLAVVINKCLLGKSASNDRLGKSRIDILWGMFYRENVDYLELNWEDFAFQINYRKLKKGIHENVRYPRRVIKKKDSISADDNIIPEPDIALELGKSMSLTEATEEEAARQVHATHARISFRDTLSVSKKMSLDLSQKLKGVQTLTREEQLAADTMQALKESKKTNKRQSGTGGSSEGTGVSPRVPDESIVVPTTSSEGTGTKPEVPDEEKVTSKATKDDDDDDKSIDLEKTDDEETDDESVHSEEHVQDDDEETDDEFVHGNEQVKDDEDEEMTHAEDADTWNGDEEITDVVKANAEKTEEVKDDIKKVELPPTSSSLSVSSRVSILEKDVQELKEADNITTLRASLKSEIPSVVNAFLRSSLGDALQKVLQKHMEELIQKYPQQADYKEMIEESVQANIINEVKNQLPKFLPKAVSDFATLVIQRTVKNTLEKTPLHVA